MLLTAEEERGRGFDALVEAAKKAEVPVTSEVFDQEKIHGTNMFGKVEEVEQKIADFLTFAVETAEPDFLDEITIFSNPFAMIPDPGNRRFLVTDGATGRVLAAGLDGDITVFSDVTGHEVLTGIARGPDGLVHVASFSQLPHASGDGAAELRHRLLS